MLERLRVLDLEGNCVDDIRQVQFLAFCPALESLTLAGNPVCVRPSSGSDAPDTNNASITADVPEVVTENVGISLRYM